MSVFDPSKPQSTDFINAFPALDQSDKGLLVTRIEALLSTALSATGRMRFVSGDIYLLDNADYIAAQFVHINAGVPARAEILDSLGNVSWAYGGTTDPITWVVQKMISAQGTFGSPLVAMTIPVLTPSTTGGTLATGTYYYKVTAIDNTSGESAGSPEASAAVTGPNGSVSVSWTTVTGAASYRIYRGATAGGEALYFTAGAPPFVDTGGTGTAGTPPTKNSAVQAQTVVGNVPNANLLGPLLSAITAADGTVVVGAAPGSGVGSQTVRAVATSANSGVKMPAFYSGAGAPNAILPAGTYQIGDLYYDTTNLIYYVCTASGSAAASTWKKILFTGSVADSDLVGPVVSSVTAGDATIVAGAPPTGAAPQSVRVNATSANTGVKVPAFYSGAGAPSGSTLAAGSYTIGDLYFDTTNNIFYVCKTAGTNSTSAWQQTGSPAPQTQVFTANGTYTTPVGAKAILSEIVGPGGNGGTGGTNQSGGGGAAGGYARKMIPTPLASYAIVLPAGGSVTASTFGAVLTANGGGNASGTTPGVGGTATGGDVNLTGADGGEGQNLAGGVSGGGGSSPFGGAGAPRSNGDNGNPAKANTGSGGSGGAATGGSTTGGAGATPLCIVTAYF